jgi:predicted SAM-dependent methyltransferase
MQSPITSESRADAALLGLAKMEAAQGRFAIKRLPDGRAMLNLACGTKMHWGWNNLDFSPYARLRRRPLLTDVLRRIHYISDQRFSRLQNVDPQIIAWNLRKGIPFADCAFDVLYHSHFLEHLDKRAAVGFLQECFRVLKLGGVLRVVVPDLELLASTYLESLKQLDRGDAAAEKAHQRAIYELFDQMVRTKVTGTTEQMGWVARVEGLFRRNAAQAGEVHQWMYDRHSLRRLLESVGFGSIQQQTASTSHIVDWQSFHLDTNEDSTPCKWESLYLEARK